jgi:protease-4
MIISILLLVLLAFSMLLNIGLFSGGATHGRRLTHTVGPKLDEVLTEDNDASAKIAIIEIRGIITSHQSDGGFGMVDLVKAQLKRCEEDKDVKAVIVKVDSPGGEVLASDEIYREINEFQKHCTKPVVASMGNLAASGGYYVSAPCRWIVANELTITGSIGVILHSWNYRGLMNKVGLRPQTYKSGKFKDMLSGERDPEEVPPEEREMVQKLIDDTYGKFKTVVADGRKAANDKNKASKDPEDQGRTLSADWTDYADGRVLSGKDAMELGFVDQIGNFEDAVKRAQKLAGIPKANLIEFQQRFDLSDIFKVFGKTQAPAIKVDLGVETPKLEAGQLYFLSPTFAK